MADKKISFKDMRSQVDVDAHNSHMSNLAHAAQRIDEAKDEAKRIYDLFVVEADQMLSEIETLAGQDTIDNKRVWELHNWSHNFGIQRLKERR